jgi:hypothetical protein
VRNNASGTLQVHREFNTCIYAQSRSSEVFYKSILLENTVKKRKENCLLKTELLSGHGGSHP